MWCSFAHVCCKTFRGICSQINRLERLWEKCSKCESFFFLRESVFLRKAIHLLLPPFCLYFFFFRTCRGPSMTCLPVQRAPWVPAWARQACQAARASRATLLSRPSLLTHLHTCQASEGLHLPRLAPLPAQAHPAQDRCHLPTCQVGWPLMLKWGIWSLKGFCHMRSVIPDMPLLLKCLKELFMCTMCNILSSYFCLLGKFDCRFNRGR